ncbi:MAG: hypothetical protein ACLVJN_02960 [Streptococcus parasanguinis]
MIDRSYLPYQSAREFQDRGMAKWAGFFLSEHTTALQTKEIDRSQLTVLPLAEQIQLLEQAFQQQTTISITTLEGNQFATYTGSIHTLSASELLLKSDGHYHRLLRRPLSFLLKLRNTPEDLFRLNTVYTVRLFFRELPPI